LARIDGGRETLSFPGSARKHAVIYKGVEYTVVATAEPDIWEWRFQIGETAKTGRTQTRLAALASRRVQSKIDAALRAAKLSPPKQDR
jgi:hypothetical protein